MNDLFLNFLSDCHSAIDAIYILGDLFEYWIGDDDVNEFNTQIIQALSATAKICNIYFIHSLGQATP